MSFSAWISVTTMRERRFTWSLPGGGQERWLHADVHRGGVIFGAFSPDGQTVVTTSMDNSARLWDVRTGNPLGQPMREQERILHAEFSPDGRRLVTAAYNWNARLWNLQPRRVTPLELHSGHRISTVAFSPDDKYLLTSGEGGMACQWDAATGQREGVAAVPGYARGLAFHGGLAFVGLSRIRETAIFGGAPIAAHHDELKCGVGVIDVASGATVATLEFTSGVEEIFDVQVLPGIVSPYISGPWAEKDTGQPLWTVPP